MVIAASRRADFSEIPVIDVSALGRQATDEMQVVARIQRACEEVGFFYISNHGVPQDLVDELFGQSRRFFAQSIEARKEIEISRSPYFRGYHPADTLGPAAPKTKIPNMLDSFNVATEPGPNDLPMQDGNPLYGPNLWPRDLPGFREAVMAYYDHMQILKSRLLSAFAMALGLPRDYFDVQYRNPLTQMRLLHYPPQPDGDIVDRIGSQPHADSGAFTILLQGEVDGLDVVNKRGEWIVAPPIKGTFVVNIANLIMWLSNNRFASTRHRVINRSGRERFSVPFFASPDYTTVVETLPQFIDTDNPQQFDPVHVGEYTLDLYRQFWPVHEVVRAGAP